MQSRPTTGSPLAVGEQALTRSCSSYLMQHLQLATLEFGQRQTTVALTSLQLPQVLLSERQSFTYSRKTVCLLSYGSAPN